MKKLFTTASILAFMGAPVLAADLVDVDTTYDWSGAYIGLNAGYAFGGDDRVGININPGPFFDDVGDLDLNGPYGGLQAGWNIQSGSWLFGIEGDIQAGDISDDFSSDDGAGNTAEGSSEVDFFATARLRAGWAIDRVLIYGTGGLAWVDMDYDVTGVDAAGNVARMSDDDGIFGYTVGGGAEFALDEAWSVKAEYLFVRLGSEDVTGDVRDAGGALTGQTATTVMTPSFHTVRLGVNYQF